MSDNESDGPLFRPSEPWRNGIAAFLGVIVVAHLVWPGLAIDGVTLGLLAGAGLVKFFDIKRINFQGIEASRKKIRENISALREAPKPAGPALPPPLPPEAEDYRIDAATAATSRSQPPKDLTDVLSWLSERIRLELIVLAGNSGRLPREPFSTLTPELLIPPLRRSGILAPELEKAIETIWRSNRLIAGGRPMPELTGLMAELGTNALEQLQRLPTYFPRVRHPDIQLFRDKSLLDPHDVRAVMIAQVDRGGVVSNVGVYARGGEYIRGRFTAWEWEMMEPNHWREAWYRDPDSGLVSLAWSTAKGVFVGREYPADWQIELRLPNADAGLEPAPR